MEEEEKRNGKCVCMGRKKRRERIRECVRDRKRKKEKERKREIEHSTSDFNSEYSERTTVLLCSTSFLV